MMRKERFKIEPYAVLILRKKNKVFLMRRFQTGFGDGFYGCAGGGVDGKEAVTYAVIREAREELGIKIKKEDLKMAHVLHGLHDHGREAIGFFIEVADWEGEPCNMEPHKCDDIGWFDLDKLPHNTLPHLIHVLDMINKGVFYSEFGWE